MGGGITAMESEARLEHGGDRLLRQFRGFLELSIVHGGAEY